MNAPVDKDALLRKIETLKEKFADPAYLDDRDAIASWERDVLEAIAAEKFPEENPIIKKILHDMEGEIRDINLLLITDHGDATVYNSCEACTRRKRLFDRKALFLRFMRVFSTDESLRDLEKRVDMELKNLEEHGR